MAGRCFQIQTEEEKESGLDDGIRSNRKGDSRERQQHDQYKPKNTTPERHREGMRQRDGQDRDQGKMS